jgi:hypothetical protein
VVVEIHVEITLAGSDGCIGELLDGRRDSSGHEQTNDDRDDERADSQRENL